MDWRKKMRFGYIRVSSIDQNEERQKRELKKYEVDQIFLDKQSGKNFERKEYLQLKNRLRPRDEIYVHELDRLGRNKKMIKDELQDFLKMGVTVRILDIPTTLMDFSEFGELQRSIMEMVNTILIEVLSTQAEAELTKIKKRQAEGIAAAKEAGRYVRCGRPKKAIPAVFPILYERWKNKEITTEDLRLALGYKNRRSVYDLIERYKIE